MPVHYKAERKPLGGVRGGGVVSLDDLAVEAGDDVTQHQAAVAVPGGAMHTRLVGGAVLARVEHQNALHPQLRANASCLKVAVEALGLLCHNTSNMCSMSRNVRKE